MRFICQIFLLLIPAILCAEKEHILVRVSNPAQLENDRVELVQLHNSLCAAVLSGSPELNGIVHPLTPDRAHRFRSSFVPSPGHLYLIEEAYYVPAKVSLTPELPT